MKVADLVASHIKPLFDKDIQLVEVEYTKKNDGMHLIIYIDKIGGVTIDDCVEVNHLVDQPLEDLNPTGDEPYFLDISSYGLDKPLKYDFQFKKYQNKKVNVKLYRKIDGRKEFVATFISKDEKKFYFSVDNQNISLHSDDIAYITPYIEF